MNKWETGTVLDLLTANKSRPEVNGRPEQQKGSGVVKCDRYPPGLDQWPLLVGVSTRKGSLCGTCDICQTLEKYFSDLVASASLMEYEGKGNLWKLWK